MASPCLREIIQSIARHRQVDVFPHEIGWVEFLADQEVAERRPTNKRQRKSFYIDALATQFEKIESGWPPYAEPPAPN